MVKTKIIPEFFTWEDGEKQRKKREKPYQWTLNTWTPAKQPSGRKKVRCDWIFTIKHNAKAEIQRCKARLVAKGYPQKYGEDYAESCASYWSARCDCFSTWRNKRRSQIYKWTLIILWRWDCQLGKLETSMQSSTEAEYVSAGQAWQELVWLHKLLLNFEIVKEKNNPYSFLKTIGDV